MAKILIILLTALVFESVGVVLLSSGLKQLGALPAVRKAEIVQFVKKAVTNRNMLLGIAFEAIFFGALLYLLSSQDVSLIWPMSSLGFVITTLAAKLVLKEEVSWTRWSGVALIVLGAGLVSWSEKKKEPKASLEELAPSIEQRP